jgi:hypothetical protein
MAIGLSEPIRCNDATQPAKQKIMDADERKDIDTTKKNSWREFFTLGEVGGYFFRRKDTNRPTNINLKMMHGINRISILVFLLGALYLVLKRLL